MSFYGLFWVALGLWVFLHKSGGYSFIDFLPIYSLCVLCLPACYTAESRYVIVLLVHMTIEHS